MKKKRLGILLALIMVLQVFIPMESISAQDPISPENVIYQVPASPNVDYNMNLDWKFSLPKGTSWPLASARASTKDAQGREFFDPAFDDSSWKTVSVPHTFNENEIFDSLANGAGDTSVTRCISFYRKHFTLGQEHAGKKFLLEFEGVRQAAYVWVNGTFVGYYEAGVTAFGFDITAQVKLGQENVIAIALDNTSGRGMTSYMSETKPGTEPGSDSGTDFQWNTNDFNPTVGGLTRDVILHVKSDVYQTLPLYSNLKTMGTYVYGSEIDAANKTAVINVEAEVRNESSEAKNLTLEVAVVDKEGKLQYHFQSEASSVPVASDKGVTYQTVVPADAYSSNPAPTDTSTVDVRKIIVSAPVKDIRLWSPNDPALYDVYSILREGETIVDVTRITTGFRKVEARGGVKGGIYINDKLTWLTGYAQRATNEWAAIGVAPDWLTDYDMSLVRESNANYIRWMHIAAQPAVIRACDKYGIVCIQPAGDKEKDVEGRQWDQRVETMRDVIIYFRNSPSVFFWECGNNLVSAAHMQEMTDLRRTLDPSADRTMGCRALAEDQKAVDASEYVGSMLGRQIEEDPNGWSYKTNGELTVQKRAVLECEYYREEAPRRVWDDFSPPSFDYVHGTTVTSEGDTWDLTSESFVVNSATAYNHYYSSRVSANSARPIYSGAAALCWTDSIQHGRNTQTETGRMSGRVDPLRLKKQSYYAFQVMQSNKPAIHIVGHWNYPSDVSAYPSNRDPKNKTVYVLASNVRYVELFINGVSVRKNGSPTDRFVYEFPNIDITQNGVIEAVGYNSRGVEVTRHTLETAGEAASIRLTPVTGPEGLLADGADVAYFDLEVVDAQGRVLPLDYSRINLSLTGPATLRGGYNSGYQVNYGDGAGMVDVAKMNTNPNVVYSECGTNRIFVRAGTEAGEITLTATRAGLPAASATITSKAVELTGGLTTKMPQSITPNIIPEEEPDQPQQSTIGMRPVTEAFEVRFGENTEIVEEPAPQHSSVDVYVNGQQVDFGTGTSGDPLFAYEAAQSVFGPVNAFLDKIGVQYSFDAQADALTMSYGGKTVVLSGSTMTVNGGESTIINQMAETIDGTLYAELSAIARGFGFNNNGWMPGAAEFRITLN